MNSKVSKQIKRSLLELYPNATKKDIRRLKNIWERIPQPFRRIKKDGNKTKGTSDS